MVDYTLNSEETLDIIIYPDPVLETSCPEVKSFDDNLAHLVKKMLNTMYAAQGIGLAAPQVGESQRVFVVDTDYSVDEDDNYENLNPRIFINPVITQKQGETLFKEGCLSMPLIREDIKRAEEIDVTYQDLEGKTQEGHFGGLEAICIQHEHDHIEGIVFLKYLSPFKRDFYRKKLLKYKKRIHE